MTSPLCSVLCLPGSLPQVSVPVYYGAADISNFAPPESFIDVRKFNSTEDLVAYI